MKSSRSVAMFPKTCASTLIEKIKRGAHQFLGTGKEDGIVIIQLYDDAYCCRAMIPRELIVSTRTSEYVC